MTIYLRSQVLLTSKLYIRNRRSLGIVQPLKAIMMEEALPLVLNVKDADTENNNNYRNDKGIISILITRIATTSTNKSTISSATHVEFSKKLSSDAQWNRMWWRWLEMTMNPRKPKGLGLSVRLFWPLHLLLSTLPDAFQRLHHKLTYRHLNP